MTLRIFGALLSPFVRKVCLVAAEKGIAYRLEPAFPNGAPSPAFLASSPFGKMPAITDGDFSLADSTAIALYLEARHPTPPLLPADPQAHGRAMWFRELGDGLIGGAGLKVLFNRLVGPKFFGVPGDEALAAQGEAQLPRFWDYLERETAGGSWLAGPDFSLGDIAVASMIRTLVYVGVEPKADAYPAVTAWYARVTARPAWRQVAAQEDAPRTPTSDQNLEKSA